MRAFVRTAFLGFALIAVASSAKAGPVLEVSSKCPTTTVALGGTVAVPVSLTTGGGASALPAVSALTFTLTYDARELTFQSVALADAVAARGGWGQPAIAPTLTPGTLSVLVAPKFQLPLPTFSAGPVVVASFAAASGASPGCSAIDFAPGSVVFSAPPLGTAVPGGSTAAGGVQVSPEICDDCIDNDGDGLIDLADPACGARQLMTISADVRSAKAKKPSAGQVKLRATLPDAIQGVSGGVRITIAGIGAPLVCESLAASAFKGNARKGLAHKRGGAGLSLVRFKTRKGRTQVEVTVKGKTLGSGERTIQLSLAVGAGRYYGLVTLRPLKGRLVYP